MTLYPPCDHLHVRDGPMRILLEDGVRTQRQIGICSDCGYAVEREKVLPKFGAWRTVSGSPVSRPAHVKKLKREARG